MKGILLSSPSPRFCVFRANESHGYEATIELNRLADERAHVGNKGVVNACASEERFWDVVAIEIDGINLYG